MKMMNSEQKHTDFSLYTFEEFLQNDFFISSMNHPTEETQKFWDEFEQMNPSNIDEYIAAKSYLEVFPKDCCLAKHIHQLIICVVSCKLNST